MGEEKIEIQTCVLVGCCCNITSHCVRHLCCLRQAEFNMELPQAPGRLTAGGQKPVTHTQTHIVPVLYRVQNLFTAQAWQTLTQLRDAVISMRKSWMDS